MTTSEYADNIIQCTSGFSQASEDLLISLERGTVKEPEELKEAFTLKLSGFLADDDRKPDSVDTTKLLTRDNCSNVLENTRMCRNRMKAARFMGIHIEPILDVAGYYRDAGLDTEYDSIMSVYNFALDMRRLYRKLTIERLSPCTH